MVQPVLGGSSAEIQKVGFFFGWLVVVLGFLLGCLVDLLLLFGFPFGNQNFTPHSAFSTKCCYRSLFNFSLRDTHSPFFGFFTLK